ncbi:GMC family oxidoreductase [Streptomyces sp. NPDC017520]|uniref:GMC family oxidoreductase n=1 Tax=Streptomyces sp. NPDC017520 TaxID=3364998 RepID=UPI0037A88CDF
MAIDPASHFDHIVVGGGSSGAVVAARLAEWTDRRVLLVEAGPDYYGRELPADLADGRTPALSSHDWGISAQGAGGRWMWLPRGRVVGGCSAINACIALRPEPNDFDDWPSGRTDWSWDAVLDAFVALENDADHGGRHHGSKGPLPLARIPTERMTPLSRAFLGACARAGFGSVEDQNEPGSTGAGPLPLNIDSDLRRVSTATAFLDPLRHHGNLTVLADTLVDSVLFSGARAVGVRVVGGGARRDLYADEVTIAAGAFGTPAILLRSGIGGARDLAEHCIDVVADLPFVGQNLADHAQVPLICAPLPGAVDSSAPCAEVVLRYTASGSTVANDMQICLLNHVEMAKYAPHLAAGVASSHAFVITANLMRAESRGTVRLASRDPQQPPVVDLDHTAEESDRIRLREGLRLAQRITTDEGLRHFAKGMLNVADLSFEDNASVDRYVSREVQTAHHPSGTAAMSSNAETGVVDSECRVFGTEGLRVADASIIPASVRANTNLTCIMIGERLANLLAQDCR